MVQANGEHRGSARGMLTRLLQVRASEIRAGDLVSMGLGSELKKALGVKASRWPGAGWPTTLVQFAGEMGQHFTEDVPVFVVRREARSR